ncbi:MAG: hypothetical protein IPG69_21320 [Flavobacteriales bacterium]|nr:hypothetical protein [Flavobacteriales bacterium]
MDGSYTDQWFPHPAASPAGGWGGYYSDADEQNVQIKSAPTKSAGGRTTVAWDVFIGEIVAWSPPDGMMRILCDSNFFALVVSTRVVAEPPTNRHEL